MIVCVHKTLIHTKMITHTSQKISLATDVVIFSVINKRLNVLLIEMTKRPFTRMWACPGGLVENQETLAEAAKKMLKSQTNVDDVYLEQLYTFDNPDRDPAGRVVSTAYFALINPKDIKLKTEEKYSDVRWFPITSLPRLAYDHKEIIKYARQRLSWKLEYTNIAYSLLPEEFPFSELQKVYEAIMGKKLDKRNFKKQMLANRIITKTNKQIRGGAHRPAYLYKFTHRTPEMISN